MRWPIDVLAYYLLDAGLPEKQTAQVILSAWPNTYGDDNYTAVVDNEFGVRRLGPYAVPGRWIVNASSTEWQGMVNGAKLLDYQFRNHPDKFNAAYVVPTDVPDELTTAVLAGIKSPRAGITPQERKDMKLSELTYGTNPFDGPITVGGM